MHVHLFIRNPRPFHVIEHIFSTGTNDRQILGRLVARYWAVVVFDLRKSQEEISPSCTSTHSWYRNIFLWVWFSGWVVFYPGGRAVPPYTCLYVCAHACICHSQLWFWSDMTNVAMVPFCVGYLIFGWEYRKHSGQKCHMWFSHRTLVQNSLAHRPEYVGTVSVAIVHVSFWRI